MTATWNLRALCLSGQTIPGCRITVFAGRGQYCSQAAKRSLLESSPARGSTVPRLPHTPATVFACQGQYLPQAAAPAYKATPAFAQAGFNTKP